MGLSAAADNSLRRLALSLLALAARTQLGEFVGTEGTLVVPVVLEKARKLDHVVVVGRVPYADELVAL